VLKVWDSRTREKYKLEEAIQSNNNSDFMLKVVLNTITLTL
jgi:hypothetical protein